LESDGFTSAWKKTVDEVMKQAPDATSVNTASPPS